LIFDIILQYKFNILSNILSLDIISYNFFLCRATTSTALGIFLHFLLVYILIYFLLL